MGKFDCDFCEKNIDGRAIIDGSKVFHTSCQDKYKAEQREARLRKKYPKVPYDIVTDLDHDDVAYMLDCNWCVVTESTSDCEFQANGFSNKEQAIEDIKEYAYENEGQIFHSLYKKGKPVKVEVKIIAEVDIED